MAEHNKHLADAAKGAGVIQPWEYAVFQNNGYMGLYNGLGAKEIQDKKRVKENPEYFGSHGQYRI